jgi:hypothetical protein
MEFGMTETRHIAARESIIGLLAESDAAHEADVGAAFDDMIDTLDAEPRSVSRWPRSSWSLSWFDKWHDGPVAPLTRYCSGSP